MKLSLILLSLSLIFLAITKNSFSKQQMEVAEPLFLMVIGGVYRAGLPTSSNVELISLDPEVEVPECLQDLHDYPRRLHWSCQATFFQGMRKSYVGKNFNLNSIVQTLERDKFVQTLVLKDLDAVII